MEWYDVGCKRYLAALRSVNAGSSAYGMAARLCERHLGALRSVNAHKRPKTFTMTPPPSDDGEAWRHFDRQRKRFFHGRSNRQHRRPLQKYRAMFRNPDAEGALRAQDDASYRESFIAENVPFIRAAAAKAVHHFVTEHDDEWSVAMISFNEAIDRYIPDRGDFAAFAKVVISRRLTDELRREYRHRNEIPVEPEILAGADLRQDAAGDDPQYGQAGQAAKAAMAREAQQAGEESARSAAEEIQEVQKILQEYGFSFFDLADASPRAAKTKTECAKAVGALLCSEELFLEMQRKKTLPMKALSRTSGVNRKILERHRRYIIAAAVILNGEYPLLAAYMDYIRKAMKT